MRPFSIASAALTLLAAATAAAAANSMPSEDWGYTTVRPGAHVFWWIYRGDKIDDPTAPLLVWQQGGPGASSTGFGNFLEVGPVNVDGSPRNTSWTHQSAALLFIDNPVGSGFSYVDDSSALTTSNAQLAADYVAVLADVTSRYSFLSTIPTFFLCESFGGHMVPAYATAVLDAVDAGSLKMNLAGIALGDSWVSGVAFTNTWVPYLRGLSVLDARDAKQIQPTVDAIAAAVASGQWAEATNLWGTLEDGIGQVSDDVDWYYALWHHVSGDESGKRSLSVPAEHDRTGRYSQLARAMPPLARKQLAGYHADSLAELMNGPVREKLNNKSGFSIPSNVTWGGQSGEVFSTLNIEFMKDITSTVDNLLKGGRIRVHVYQGSVDLICCTPGAEQWMSNLTWSGMNDFYAATKTPIYPEPGNMNTGAFAKGVKGSLLSMYFLMRSGHMAPGAPSIGGMPDTMYNILQEIIKAGGV